MMLNVGAESFAVVVFRRGTAQDRRLMSSFCMSTFVVLQNHLTSVQSR